MGKNCIVSLKFFWFIVSLLIMILTSATIMQLYFYNDVMSSRDMDRDRFIDIRFDEYPDAKTVDSMDEILSDCVPELKQYMYVLSEENGHCIMGYNSDNDVPEDIVYGAIPYFVEEYKTMDTADFNRVSVVCVESNIKISADTAHIIKKRFKELKCPCKVYQQTDFGWLISNVSFYKYMLIMGLIVFVFP